MRILKSTGVDEVGRILLGKDSAFADIRPEDAESFLQKSDEAKRAQHVPVVIEKTPEKRRASRPFKKSGRSRSQNSYKAHQ
jgi:hypothetical protein